MQHFDGYFDGFQNLSLYYQKWQADSAKAIIVLIHGFGEHSSRYKNVVNKLVPAGYTIYSFDHRGHGKSPGSRGHVMDWQEFTEDVDAFMHFVNSEKGELPLFIIGHSMGGLIVLNYVLLKKPELKGVISSAPLLVQPGVSPVLLLLGKMMSKIWPAFTIDTKLDVNTISRDPKVLKEYQEDNLVHSLASARFGTELEKTQKWTMEHASEFTMPLLLIHGEADELVPPYGSEEFYEKASSQDKLRHLYPGGKHESHNDVEHERVIQDMLDWLEKHL